MLLATASGPGTDKQVSLYAFSGTDASQLVTLPAGTWPKVGGNANLVPVVANGRVYVASYKQLSIFGPATGAQAAATIVQPTAAPAPLSLPPGGHEVYGTAVGLQDSTLTLRTRTGQVIEVNILPAQQATLYAPVAVGAAVLVRGVYDSSGVLQAQVVAHAKPDPAFWPPDR